MPDGVIISNIKYINITYRRSPRIPLFASILLLPLFPTVVGIKDILLEQAIRLDPSQHY